LDVKQWSISQSINQSIEREVNEHQVCREFHAPCK